MCSRLAALFIINYMEYIQEPFGPQNAANVTHGFTKLQSINCSRKMGKRTHQGLPWQPTLKAASDPGDFQSPLRTPPSEMHTLHRLRKTPGVSIFTVIPPIVPLQISARAWTLCEAARGAERF